MILIFKGLGMILIFRGLEMILIFRGLGMILILRGLGMMTPNGLQPYSTISYANGPGFDDHFDQVSKPFLFCSYKMVGNIKVNNFIRKKEKVLKNGKSSFSRLLGFGRTSQKWTHR